MGPVEPLQLPRALQNEGSDAAEVFLEDGSGVLAGDVPCTCSPEHDPCNAKQGACQAVLEEYDEAEELCGQLPSARGFVQTAYVAQMTHCSARWCCKELTTAKAEKSRKRFAAAVAGMQSWLPRVASDVITGSEAVLVRAGPLLDQGGGKLKEETRNSLALVQWSIVEAAQATLDAMASCSGTGKELVLSHCGNIFNFAAETRDVANKLFGALAEYGKLLNLILYGTETPYSTVSGMAEYLLSQARIAAGKAIALAGSGAARVFSLRTLVDFKSFCWRRRMAIAAMGIVTINAALIGDIIVSAMAATTVSQGMMPVLEAILSQLVTKVLCPLVANPLVLGLVSQWLVHHILANSLALEIMEDILLPFDGLAEGLRFLKAKLKGKQWEPMKQSAMEALLGFNDSPWGMVLYSALASHFTAFLRVASTMMCSVASGLTLGEQTLANAAVSGEQHATSAIARAWTTGVEGATHAVGGDTAALDHALETQQRLQALEAGMPSFVDWLGELHRLLADLVARVGGIDRLALGSLDAVNEALEAPMQLLGRMLQRLDASTVGPALHYVVGAGAATLFGLSRVLPERADERLVSPDAMQAFFDVRKGELLAAVAEARDARPHLHGSPRPGEEHPAGATSETWLKPVAKLRQANLGTQGFIALWQGKMASDSGGQAELPYEDHIERLVVRD